MTLSERVEIRELAFAAEDAVLRAWERDDQVPSDRELVLDTQAHTPLDRLTQVGVALAEHQRYEALEMVIASLAKLFGAAGEQRALNILAHPIADELQTTRWFEIATRVYVIGAVSVTTEAFGGVRSLILQQPNQKRVGRFWLRETVTALARLNRFKPQSLIGPISEFVSDHPVFARRFGNNKDRVVSDLCQFDFLQCVISVAETQDLTACYPNFGSYFKERTEPIISDLVTGGRSRETIPKVNDGSLAEIIRELDELAHGEFFSVAGWHRASWSDPRISTFLASHKPEIDRS